jgi:hypothetical protein
MRNFLSRKKTHFITTFLSATMMVLLMLSSRAYSQGNDEQQWWFNVELIVFKRALSPSNNENFDQAQFELDTANANNLLYLAAIKQASLYDALQFALPLCDEKLNHNRKFGVKFDFEFDPRSLSEFFVPNPDDENQVVTELLDETSLAKEQNTDVDAYVVNLEVSNQTLIRDLLSPFFIDQTVNEDEYENTINSLTDIAAQGQNVEPDSLKTHLTTLNNSIEVLNEKLKHNESVSNHIACLNAEPREPELTDSALPSVGSEIFSETIHFTGASQVISAEESFLQDYAAKVLRQRDIQPLLYTAWRQEVEFGSENAEFYKVRAGNLLETLKSVSYEKWHQQYEALAINSQATDEETFFADLKADLISNENIDWLAEESASGNKIKTTFQTQKKYELEGQLKVFLDYVNQVPYLHIDSEFKHYRVAVDTEQNSILQSYPLKQRRRVISKQIHYFDHPAFGLIVRLERFTPPVIEEVVIENTITNEQ